MLKHKMADLSKLSLAFLVNIILHMYLVMNEEWALSDFIASFRAERNSNKALQSSLENKLKYKIWPRFVVLKKCRY